MNRPEERAASVARAAGYYVLVALGVALWWLLSRDGGLPFVILVCAAAVLIVGRLLALGVSYWRFARRDTHVFTPSRTGPTHLCDVCGAHSDSPMHP